MCQQTHSPCTAFEGFRRVAAGELASVAVKAKEALDRGD